MSELLNSDCVFTVSLFQEEDISNLVECMALNSASTTSDSESEVSEVRRSVQYLKLMI